MDESPPNPVPSSDHDSPEPYPAFSADDCFAPPTDPCECYCLHCGRVFSSDDIWLQKVIGGRDGFEGFWMCPTPNCSGAGFTFDIFPTDPQHPANDGWVEDDECEFSEDGDPLDPDATVEEWDPNETKYAELDEIYGPDDPDIEGEEWKLGLQPGESPPEPPWAAEARRHYEEEQKKYDQPDQRPREVDWSNRPDPPPSSFGTDDIPF